MVKRYLCFQNDGRTALATQRTKSRALTEVIDTNISIVSFEQQYEIIKGVLQ